jgi:basic membrane protein A
VKAGCTKLGFMGGMAVPAVIRYGYGFVKGAEDAAKEAGVAEVTINYNYTGGFDATPEAQAMAASWYKDGVEIIFGCGGAVGNSVMAAAEAAEGDKYVIGVDVDQSPESETVVISAMKGLKASVYQTITAYYEGNFPGGATTVKDASNDGVALPMESNKLEGFTQEDYDALYAKLAAGEIEIPTDKTANSADALGTEIVKVTVIG